MKQTTNFEKMDPLTRIQEEIKEVVRREQEHKQFISTIGSNNADEGHDQNEPLSLRSHTHDSTDDELIVEESSPAIHLKTFTNGHHSDDSGISSASSPVHGKSSNSNRLQMKKSDLKLDLQNVGSGSEKQTGSITGPAALSASYKETRYIRPNCYNMTPEPPQQKLIQTIPSTPNVNAVKTRKFTMGPAQKGLMQRFIASRGKITLQRPASDMDYPQNIVLRDKSVVGLINNRASLRVKAYANDSTNASDLQSFSLDSQSKPFIYERDENKRPLRPGYIPVEVKIKRELKDLKSRESELRKIRKTQQSNPDLLNISDDENSDIDSDEQFFGLNKLRTSKSICDLSACSNGLDEDWQSNRYTTLKPAVSLAQLCDLDPQEETISSHSLIAKFESLIQKSN